MPNNLKEIIRRVLDDDKVIEKGKSLVQRIREYVAIDDPKTKSERQKELLNLLNDDNNLLDSSTLSELQKEEVISFEQLGTLSINKKFISALKDGLKRPKLVTENNSEGKENSRLKVISRPSTEVYFWGIPSSGKTCAIGAILSMMASGGSKFVKSFYMDNGCQGYEYMMRLKSIFKTDNIVTMLPAGTSIKATYEMGFDLVDHNRRRHPITFIDMAGELIRIMFKSDAGKELTNDERESLNVVDDILVNNRSENRKLHFFVLEYGGEDRQYENLSQDSYLTAAMNYLLTKNIFKYASDGIYLLITKADNTNVNEDNLQAYIAKYIKNKGYKGFCDALKGVCTDNNINDGFLEILPFSLGQVCFKDYCLFDSKYTDDVIEKLVERTWSDSSFRTKWWARPFVGVINLLKS